MDWSGQHRYSRRSVLQTDVGRSFVLFQGLVVWGKPLRKRLVLIIKFIMYCSRYTIQYLSVSLVLYQKSSFRMFLIKTGL